MLGEVKFFWSMCPSMTISELLLVLFFTKLGCMIHVMILMHSTSLDAESKVSVAGGD